jgi:hypothetical protein
VLIPFWRIVISGRALEEAWRRRGYLPLQNINFDDPTWALTTRIMYFSYWPSFD